MVDVVGMIFEIGSISDVNDSFIVRRYEHEAEYFEKN